MGVLDEAIREHLDLKRRRGADPTEVERDERDALGPVRRAPELAPGDDSEPAPEAGEPREVAYEDDPAYENEPDYEDQPAAHEADDAPVSHAEPAGPREPAAPDEEAASWNYDANEPAAAEPAPPPAHGYADHTVEYDAQEAFGEPHEAAPPEPPDHLSEHETAEHLQPPAKDEDEDVLEETPEFLQDTPDHDRLWFEQRPPRDFDFDR